MDGYPSRVISSQSNSPLHEFRMLAGLCMAILWAAQHLGMPVFFVTFVTRED